MDEVATSLNMRTENCFQMIINKLQQIVTIIIGKKHNLNTILLNYNIKTGTLTKFLDPIRKVRLCVNATLINIHF